MPDSFSRYHPLTNFLYFAAVIGFSVVIRSPYYICVSVLDGAVYYMLLYGRKALTRLGVFIPMFLVVAAINPLFNTNGDTVLFQAFGHPYTLEALIYGCLIAGMLVGMLLWFGCYSAVLTSDKFVALFGGQIPSLSLLLVMVLRLIPSFMRKARQIMGARKCIGKGVGDQATFRQKLDSGMKSLSALTDWALEGSITTADSMRSRGYGGPKRTHYQPFRLTAQDVGLLFTIALISAGVLLTGRTGTDIGNTVQIDPPGLGLAFYAILMLIPSILRGREALMWHISLSKI